MLSEKGRGFKDLTDKAKKFLKDGDLDKLSGEDLKKVKPKDILDIAVSLKYILLVFVPNAMIKFKDFIRYLYFSDKLFFVPSYHILALPSSLQSSTQ